MEIGISPEKWLDIGLNLAGYMSAGLFVLVVKSIFTKSAKEVRPERVTEFQESPITKSKAVRSSETGMERDFEFVNLQGVDWVNQKSRSSRSTGRNNRVRNREEAIRRAKEVLARVGQEQKARKNIPLTDGELAMINRENNLQTSGRIA